MVLPDSTVIVHGSLALGDYQSGKSDVDLLVLSEAPTDGLVEAVEVEWNREPTNLDLRVVGYRDAAFPTPGPRMRLYVGVHDAKWEIIEGEAIEPDLVIEFSLVGSLGLRS